MLTYVYIYSEHNTDRSRMLVAALVIFLRRAELLLSMPAPTYPPLYDSLRTISRSQHLSRAHITPLSCPQATSEATANVPCPNGGVSTRDKELASSTRSRSICKDLVSVSKYSPLASWMLMLTQPVRIRSFLHNGSQAIIDSAHISPSFVCG